VNSERIGGLEASSQEWSRLLDATLSGLSGVGSLNLLDAEGTVVLSTNPAVTGTSRRGLYLHRRLRNERSDDLVIGPPAPAEHVSGIRIPLGRALHDAAGNFTGFIAGTFQPERLRGVYEAINVGPRGIIQLFNRNGDLLFSQPYPNPLAGEATGAPPMPEAARSGGASGFIRAPLVAGGDSYLTAWRRLADSGLVVTVSLAKDDALADWHTELLTVGGSAVGMGFMLLLAGGWITASSRAHARAVAERDRTGAALERNQAQLNAIMENSPSAIVLKDPAGRYLLANRTYLDWLGLTTGQVLGRTAEEIFGAEESTAAVADDRRVAVAEEVVAREHDMVAPGGERRRVVSTKFPVRFANNGGLYIGGIFTDVTQSREAEEKLRQAQKMEAVGQLTGGVAHDFNNLLTAVIGNIDLAQERVAGDAATHRFLETALRAATRGSDLTNRLLAFSRRQPLAPFNLDVNQLILDCRLVLQRTIGAEVDIELFLRDDVWLVHVDANQLENALLNLAINARDAMPKGGKLTIETSNVELDADYAARNPDVMQGQHVMISVSDSGSGIDPGILKRVFEPFFTTKAQGKGTGLGLSMVYGFAKQSGGHIRIYSEAGQGTTVKLYLPRTTSTEAPAALHHAELGEVPGGSETVLIVEDDPDVAEFASAALETLGYRVTRVSDGPAALLQLEDLPLLDLLVTDVVLPGGMNGREVAERFRDAFPGLKVLFVSGYAESIIVHQGRLETGVDFLAKPFAKAALARKVREILDSLRSGDDHAPQRDDPT
jgi:PAS domain S-box-containing protein